jgi:hypothetical protein
MPRGVELRHFRLHWRELCLAVAVRTAREPNELMVSSYADVLIAEYEA